jgi:hypothetical protein
MQHLIIHINVNEVPRVLPSHSLQFSKSKVLVKAAYTLPPTYLNRVIIESSLLKQRELIVYLDIFPLRAVTPAQLISPTHRKPWSSVYCKRAEIWSKLVLFDEIFYISHCQYRSDTYLASNDSL